MESRTPLVYFLSKRLQMYVFVTVSWLLRCLDSLCHIEMCLHHDLSDKPGVRKTQGHISSVYFLYDSVYFGRPFQLKDPASLLVIQRWKNLLFLAWNIFLANEPRKLPFPTCWCKNAPKNLQFLGKSFPSKIGIRFLLAAIEAYTDEFQICTSNNSRARKWKKTCLPWSPVWTKCFILRLRLHWQWSKVPTHYLPVH